ncbi:hypothetical protein B5M47_02785 [candidate division CPR3 bacterium 4484_211]|uniref:Aminoglycoside phosphotransferase domain-containing protein n=1 Tax=candidate division CPR3 bacterium 4484_211 TaxID=1968527 RepID=A0A1W9NXY8_UNCC3|nr:MAG: hypothetical protein B5M47_02785 [candidate division CPR3 bacterium 4484_211]
MYFSKEDLQDLLSCFGIKSPIKEHVSLNGNRGYSNYGFYIKADDEYLLRIAKGLCDGGRYELECQVLSILKEKGVSVPVMLKTTSGDVYANRVINKRQVQACLFYFIPHDRWPLDFMTSSSFRRIVRQIYKMHRILSSTTLKRPDKRFDLFRYASTYWRRLPSLVVGRELLLGGVKVVEFQRQIDLARELIAEYLKREISIPRQMIHSDLNLMNILVRDGKFEAIVDFDSLGYGSVMDDWALFSVEWNRYGIAYLEWPRIRDLILTQFPREKRGLLKEDMYFRSLAYLVYRLISYLEEKDEEKLKAVPFWFIEKYGKLAYLLGLR